MMRRLDLSRHKVFLTLALFSLLSESTVVAQNPSTAAGQYTLTVFVSEGTSIPTAAAQASSGNGPNLGHVFVELTNGPKQMYLGYYGDPENPKRGQLRPDADLAANGDWDIKKTYSISERGYQAAHWLIDQWGTDGVTWSFNHNCGDFAEAVAQIAGLDLHPLKTHIGGYNRPLLWSTYLKTLGGVINISRINLTGSWRSQDVDRSLLRLSQSGRSVVAVKVEGEGTYVPIGEVSFRGTFGSNPFSVSWQYAQEGFKDPYWQQVPVEVKDKNTFLAQGHVWKREPPISPE